jgi:hypothetical protein
MKRTILLYVVLVSLFGFGMYLTLDHGRHLLPPKPSATVAATITQAASASSSGASSLLSALNENAKGPLSRLLLQVIVILVATRTVGALFARFGQPPVIGEMAAGILLGPSLLGLAVAGGIQFRISQGVHGRSPTTESDRSLSVYVCGGNGTRGQLSAAEHGQGGAGEPYEHHVSVSSRLGGGDLGTLSPRIVTMMALMALAITTAVYSKLLFSLR